MGKDARIRILPADKTEWIKARTEYYLTRGKAVQLSAPFDAPQFARDFINLAKAACRTSRLCIMQRGSKFDARGNPKISKSTGRKTIGWVPYSGRRD